MAKTSSRKKSSSTGRVVVKGVAFRKDSCSTSKTAATAKAKKLRSSGYRAIVRKTASGHCAYRGPKRQGCARIGKKRK